MSSRSPSSPSPPSSPSIPTTSLPPAPPTAPPASPTAPPPALSLPLAATCPTLALVWVAASIGPSTARSPFRHRLTSKQVSGIDVAHTCSLIAHAHLPLRIASTLLKGTAVIYRHQLVALFNLVNQAVNHLRLLVTSPFSPTTTAVTITATTTAADAKDALTLPELGPDFLDLVLAPANVLHLPEFPPAVVPISPRLDLLLERRRAVTPMSASFLSAYDASLLPEAVGMGPGPSATPDVSRRDGRPSRPYSPLMPEWPHLVTSDSLMSLDFDLGMDLPPLPPVPSTHISPVLPSVYSPDTSLPPPIPMPYTPFPISIGAEPSISQVPTPVSLQPPLEPAVKKRRLATRAIRIDKLIELPVTQWRDASLITGSYPPTAPSAIQVANVTTRVLGPLVPDLAPEFASKCTIDTGILLPGRPYPPAVEPIPDIETRRAVSVEEPARPPSSLSYLALSPQPVPETYPWSINIQQQLQQQQQRLSGIPSFVAPSPVLVSPMLPPSISPIRTFLPFPSSDVSGGALPISSPTIPPYDQQRAAEEHRAAKEEAVTTDQYLTSMQRESSHFLVYTETLMDAHATDQLEFNDLVGPAHLSKSAAAQALYHIVALTTLGHLKVVQLHPYAPIYVQLRGGAGAAAASSRLPSVTP